MGLHVKSIPVAVVIVKQTFAKEAALYVRCAAKQYQHGFVHHPVDIRRSGCARIHTKR